MIELKEPSKLSKLIYISPSIFPSQAANSTHVILQVDELAKLYEQVLVIGMAAKDEGKSEKILDKLKETYDVNLKNVHFELCPNFFGFAENLVIALFSVKFFLFYKDYNLVTRNIYAAFFGLLLLKKGFLYETHTVETGFRAVMQRILLRSKRIRVIVISQSLKEMLVKKYGSEKHTVSVLHDAARPNLLLNNLDKVSFPNAVNYKNILGYFGALHPGRGIDIIEAMAKQLPNSLFVIFGPTGQNIEFEERARTIYSNIHFYGFISHKEIHENMRRCDILLMPYQNVVSIGKSGSDTSKWMSPMKMFEYMAAGRPIISSNLPVLKEVLVEKLNALLVTPDDVSEWVEAANLLQENPELSNRIALSARSDYESEYNWCTRALKLRSLINNVS